MKRHLYHGVGSWGQPSLPHALKWFSEGYEIWPTHPQEQGEDSKSAGVLVLQLCLARGGQSTMSWGHLQHSLGPVMGVKVLESGMSLQYAFMSHFNKPSGNWSCPSPEGKVWDFQKVSEFRLVRAASSSASSTGRIKSFRGFQSNRLNSSPLIPDTGNEKIHGQSDLCFAWALFSQWAWSKFPALVPLTMAHLRESSSSENLLHMRVFFRYNKSVGTIHP